MRTPFYWGWERELADRVVVNKNIYFLFYVCVQVIMISCRTFGLHLLIFVLLWLVELCRDEMTLCRLIYLSVFVVVHKQIINNENKKLCDGSV